MPTQLYLLFLCFVTCAFAQDRWCTPGAWCRLDDGQSLVEYAVFPNVVVNRLEAEAFCVDNFGDLLSVPSRNVREQLLALLPVAQWDGAWTGLQYVDGRYEFTTGEPFLMDTLITTTRDPCYAFAAHPAGLVLRGERCAESRLKVACQRRAASIAWQRLPHHSLQWKYFTAPVTVQQAREVCVAEGGDLGFLPSITAAREVARHVHQRLFRWTPTMPLRYDAFGAWVGLTMDPTFMNVSWRATHGEPLWVPPIHSPVISQCMFLGFDVRSSVISAVRFSMTPCSERRPFICTKASPIFTIFVPPLTSWERIKGFPAGTIDSTLGTVTVRPAVQRTTFVALRSTHPRMVDLSAHFVVIRPGERSAHFQLNRFEIVRDVWIEGRPGEVDGAGARIVNARIRNFTSVTPSATASQSIPSTPSRTISHSSSATVSKTADERSVDGETTVLSTNEIEPTSAASDDAPTTAPEPEPSTEPPPTPPPTSLPPAPPPAQTNRPAAPNEMRFSLESNWLIAGESLRITVVANPVTTVAMDIHVTPYVIDAEPFDPMLFPHFTSRAFSAAEIRTFTFVAPHPVNVTIGLSVSQNYVCPDTAWVFVSPRVAVQLLPPVSRVSGRGPGSKGFLIGDELSVADSYHIDTIIGLQGGGAELVVSYTADPPTLFSFPLNPFIITPAVSATSLLHQVRFACAEEGRGTVAATVTAINAPKFASATALQTPVIDCVGQRQIRRTQVPSVMRIGAANAVRVTLIVDKLPDDAAAGAVFVTPRLTRAEIGGAGLPPVNVLPPRVAFRHDAPHTQQLLIAAHLFDDVPWSLTFALDGSTAHGYLPPPPVVIKVTELVRPFFVDPPASVVAGAPRFLALDLVALPFHEGVQVDVIFMTTPSSLLRITPPTLRFIAGSTNLTLATVLAEANRETLASLGTDFVNITLGVAVAGLGSAEYDLSEASVPLVVRGPKNAALQQGFRAAVGVERPFNVTLSAPPDANTTLRLRWRMDTCRGYLSIAPSEVTVVGAVGGDVFLPTQVSFTMRGFLPLGATPIRTELYLEDAAASQYAETVLPLSLHVDPPDVVEVSNVPTALFSESSQPHAVYVRITRELLPGERIVVRGEIPAKFMEGLEFDPWEVRWEPGESVTRAKQMLLSAWRTFNGESIPLHFAATVPEGFSPVPFPRASYTLHVIPMSSILVRLPSLMVVGQSVPASLRIARFPPALLGATATLTTPHLTVTPTADESGDLLTTAALSFSPPILTFRLLPAQPLVESFRVTALSSTAAEGHRVSVQLSGPLSEHFNIAMNHTVRVQPIVVRVTHLPGAVYVGEAAAVEIALAEPLPCGELRLTLACAECDAFVLTPSSITWDSSSALVMPAAILGIAAADQLPISTTLHYRCNDFQIDTSTQPGRAALTTELPRDSIKVIDRDTLTVLSTATPDDHTGRYIGPSGTPVTISIALQNPSLPNPQGTFIEAFDEGVKVFAGVIHDAVPQELVINAPIQRPSRNVVFVSNSTRIVQPVFFAITIVRAISVVAARFSERYGNVSVGVEMEFTLALTDEPPLGSAVMTLLCPHASFEVPSFTLFSGAGTTFVIRAKTLQPSESTAIQFEITGSAARFFAPVPPLTFRIMQRKSVVFVDSSDPQSVLPPVMRLPLPVGTTHDIGLRLSQPPEIGGVVWAIALPDLHGFATFSDTVLWVDDSGFDAHRTVSIAGVVDSANITLRFLVFSSAEEYVSPTEAALVIELLPRREVAVWHHRDTMFINESHVVQVVPSESPTLFPLILHPELDPQPPAGVEVTFTPSQLEWMEGELPMAKSLHLDVRGSQTGLVFELHFHIVAPTEYSLAPNASGLSLFVADHTAVGVDSWPSQLVVGPENAVMITFRIHNLPQPAATVLRVALSYPDVLATDVPEVQFGVFEQPHLAQSMTIHGIQPSAPFSLDGGALQVAPTLFGTALEMFTSFPRPITVYPKNVLALAYTSLEGFEEGPIIIDASLSYAPVSEIRVDLVTECDAACQVNRLFPDDFDMSPRFLHFGARSLETIQITITPRVPGKQFLLKFIPVINAAHIESPSPLRIQFPPQRHFVVTPPIPALLPVGEHRFTVSPGFTLTSDNFVDGFIALSAVSSSTIVTARPPVLQWEPAAFVSGGAGAGVARQLTLVASSPTMTNISWALSSAVMGVRAPPLATAQVLPSRTLEALGFRSEMFSGGAQVDINFVSVSSADEPSATDNVRISIAVNDTSALAVEPSTVSFDPDVPQLNRFSLFPLTFAQSLRQVRVELIVSSVPGIFALRQSTFYVAVRRQKTVQVTLRTSRVAVGRSAVATVRLSAPPSVGEVLLIVVRFSGGNALRTTPPVLYFTGSSPITREVVLLGERTTGTEETLSFTPRNSSEFQQLLISRQFAVDGSATAVATIPQSIGIERWSAGRFELTRRLFDIEGAVKDMVVVTFMATPTVIEFDPPVLRFDSDHSLEQTFRLRGRQATEAVNVRYEITGEFASSYDPPSDVTVDIIEDNALLVGIPLFIELEIGVVRTFELSIPIPLAPFEVFRVNSELTCPTFARVLDVAPDTLEWRSGEPLVQVLSLTPLEASEPCTLKFVSSGNSTAVIGNGGVWSLQVLEAPKLRVSILPPRLYVSNATSVTLQFSLDAAPRMQSVVLETAAVVPGTLVVSPSVVLWRTGDTETNLIKNVSIWAPLLTPSRFAELKVNVSAPPGINTSLVPGTLTFALAPQVAVNVAAFQAQLFTGPQNARTFQIVLDELPAAGETIQVRASFTGALGSLVISPSTLQWIGGMSQQRSADIYIEGVQSQSQTQLRLEITGSPRYAREDIVLPLQVESLFPISFEPPLPQHVNAEHTYDFMVRLSVGGAVIPPFGGSSLTVTPMWQSVPGCVRFNPPSLRFSSVTGTSLPVRMIVGDGCGASVIDVVTSGWPIFHPNPIRTSVATTSLAKPVIGKLPPATHRPLWEDAPDFFFPVDIHVPPRAYERVEVSMHIQPPTPCVRVEPSHLPFIGGDNLPTRRFVSVSVLCATPSPVRLELSTLSSNSTLHLRYTDSFPIDVLPSSSGGVSSSLHGAAIACDAAMVTQSSWGRGRCTLSAFNGTTLESRFVLVIRTSAQVSQQILALMKADVREAFLNESVAIDPIVSVNGLPVDGNFMVYPLPASDQLTLSFDGQQLFGGTVNVSLHYVNNGDVAVSRIIRVEEQIFVTRGVFSILNGPVRLLNYAFGWPFLREVLHGGDNTSWPVVRMVHLDLPTIDVSETDVELPMLEIYPGDLNRVLLEVSISRMLPYVPMLESMERTLCLEAVTNNSAAVSVFPATLEWDAARPFHSQQTYMTASSSLTEVTDVLLHFKVAGTAARFVNASTIRNMVIVLRVQPLQRVTMCALPPVMYAGQSNRIMCPVTSPLPNGVSVQLLLSGSVDTVDVSPRLLTWGDDPRPATKNVTIVGRHASGSPVTLAALVSGRFVQSAVYPRGVSRTVSVVPFEQVTMTPSDAVVQMFVGANRSVAFSPHEAQVVLSSTQPTAVRVIAGMGNTFNVTALAVHSGVIITPAIDTTYAGVNFTLPPPPFYVQVRPPKSIIIRGRGGFVSQLDAFVHVPAVLEVVLEQVPLEGTLTVRPVSRNSDGYIVFPTSFTFTQRTPRSVIFTFVGNHERAPAPVTMSISGSVHEYDASELGAVSIAIRRRVDVTVLEVEPINRLRVLQWLGWQNRQTITVRLLNRTTETVRCRLVYDGPAGMALFQPAEVVFIPVLSGLEAQQTQQVEIVALQPQPPRDILLVVNGPPEVNSRVISVARIQFGELRTATVTRMGFTNELFVREANQRTLRVELSDLPDEAPVRLDIVPVGPPDSLVIMPRELHWPLPSDAANASMRTRSLQSTFIGQAPGQMRVDLRLDTADLRFNFSLVPQSFHLLVRPLIRIHPEHPSLPSAIQLYVGDLSRQMLVVRIEDLPIAQFSVVTVTPSFTLNYAAPAPGTPTLLSFGRSLDAGATNATLVIVGLPRLINGSSESIPSGLPPRQTRLFFTVQGPTEFDTTVMDVLFDVHDLIGFEVIDFPASVVEGPENFVSFTVRPREPPNDLLVLQSQVDCTVLFLSPTEVRWEAGDMTWRHVRVHATSRSSSCTMRLSVDAASSRTTHFVPRPLQQLLVVEPRPRVELVSLSEEPIRPSAIRERGISVSIVLFGASFRPDVPIGWNERPADGILVNSSVSREQERLSFDHLLFTNGSGFVSFDIDENRTAMTIHFARAERFASLTQELVTIHFFRGALARNVTLDRDGGGDRVTFVLSTEATLMMTEPQRAVFQNVIGAAVMANSLFFLGATTGASKMTLLIKSPACPSDGAFTSLHWDEKAIPFLSVGDAEDLGEEMSVLLANVGAVFLATLAHFMICVLDYVRRSRGSFTDRTLSFSLGRLFFPLSTIIGVFFFQLPIVRVSLYLILNSPSALYRTFAGLVFIAFAIGAPGFVFALLIVDFECTHTSRDATEPKKSKFSLSRFFTTRGEWQHPSDLHFLRRFGRLFVELRPRRRWYFIVDIVLVTALAILDAPRITTRVACVSKLSVVAFVFVLQLLTTLILRPFARPFHNAVFIAFHFGQAVIAIFVMSGSAASAGEYWGLVAAVFVVLLITIGLVGKAFIDVVIFFLAIFKLSKAFDREVNHRFVTASPGDTAPRARANYPNSSPSPPTSANGDGDASDKPPQLPQKQPSARLTVPEAGYEQSVNVVEDVAAIEAFRKKQEDRQRHLSLFGTAPPKANAHQLPVTENPLQDNKPTTSQIAIASSLNTALQQRHRTRAEEAAMAFDDHSSRTERTSNQSENHIHPRSAARHIRDTPTGHGHPKLGNLGWLTDEQQQLFDTL